VTLYPYLETVKTHVITYYKPVYTCTYLGYFKCLEFLSNKEKSPILKCVLSEQYILQNHSTRVWYSQNNM